ncbi:MAG: hypothetical protein ACOYMG_22735 [Candidatus Methylumidiphilus sp.]
MSAELKYGLGFIMIVALFYYYYDEIFEFITEPEIQVSVGQALGITRERDREKSGGF